MMSGEIDAVFTWVDGGDPEFLASKALHAAQWSSAKPQGWETRSGYTGEAELRERPVQASHSQARFRNKEELRFALRSIAQNAPWIRRIYIVTNGQVPPWLNLHHPRIAIVPHTSLFEDPQCLPTFNSNAIEATLHRIPGLSDDFLYFNDDFFLGRPVTMADFVEEDGRHRLFVEESRKMPRDLTDRSMIAHSWAFNNALLDDLVQVNAARKMFAHTPQLYNKHILAELQLAWREHFHRTLHNRFRTAFDAAFRLLYTGYVGEGMRAILSQNGTTSFGVLSAVTQQNYIFIKAGDPQTDYRGAMAMALELRPAFFCVNDELPDGSGAEEEAGIALLTRNFLLRFFPEPCVFEKGGDLPAISTMIASPAPQEQGRARVVSASLSAGQPVIFGLGGFAPDARAGWHNAEPGGVWTRGPYGKIHLSADPQAVGAGFSIRWTGRVLGAEAPNGRLLKVTIQLGDDADSARTTEYQMANDDHVTLVAEAPVPFAGWRGNLVLSIERLVAPRPSDLGSSTDARPLGTYLQEVTLLPDGVISVQAP